MNIKIAGGIALLALAGNANAIMMMETGDAGQTLGTAQTLGAGTTSILGTLAPPGQASTDVDLYRFGWGGGVLSVNSFGPPNVGDPQLFLFDAAGNGVAENDDSAAGGLQSEITLNLAAGVYHLAISLFNNDPIDAGGNELFDFPTSFLDLNGNTIQGPTGAGPLFDWVDTAASTRFGGQYLIAFDDGRTSLVPTRPGGDVAEPGILALMAAGMIGFAARRR